MSTDQQTDEARIIREELAQKPGWLAHLGRFFAGFVLFFLNWMIVGTLVIAVLAYGIQVDQEPIEYLVGSGIFMACVGALLSCGVGYWLTLKVGGSWAEPAARVLVRVSVGTIIGGFGLSTLGFAIMYADPSEEILQLLPIFGAFMGTFMGAYIGLAPGILGFMLGKDPFGDENSA